VVRRGRGRSSGVLQGVAEVRLLFHDGEPFLSDGDILLRWRGPSVQFTAEAVELYNPILHLGETGPVLVDFLRHSFVVLRAHISGICIIIGALLRAGRVGVW
jgi:hypothetical protein